MIIKPVNLPAGIFEDDLVDLADGRLSREREGAVLAAMRANPGLGLIVKRMREDAGLLAGMPVKAPAGLAEGVEARLETLALADLAKAAAATAEAVPAPRIEIEEPGPFRFLVENVWTRRLAMAASLAIVAGVAVWGARVAMRPEPIRPSTVIAESTAGVPEAPVAPTAVTLPAPIDLAEIDPEDVVDMGPAPVLALMPVAAPETMTDASAAKLAREGRLIVTVRAPLSAPTIRRMEGLARGMTREAWRSVGVEQTPVEYAMLRAPSVWPSEGVPAGPSPALPTTIVGSDPAVSPTGVASEPAVPLPKLVPVVKAIYSVEIEPGDEAMAALVKAIREALPTGATLELRRSPAAIADAPVLEPESVLWWNASPSRWVRRVSVPVVVEGLE